MGYTNLGSDQVSFLSGPHHVTSHCLTPPLLGIVPLYHNGVKYAEIKINPSKPSYDFTPLAILLGILMTLMQKLVPEVNSTEGSLTMAL